MNRIEIGRLSISAVVERAGPTRPTWLLPDATPEAVERHRSWLAPHFLDDKGRFLQSIHAFVVQTPGLTMLVDTCVGNDKDRGGRAPFHMMQTPFLEDLASAGFPPELVDVVFCTHLHIDHVGWNTRLHDGRWVPTFPNARYLTGRREFEYWQQQDQEPSGDAVQLPGLEDSVLPLFEAGLLNLVDDGYELAEGLTLLPLPGHTPGQLGVRADGSAPAVFCGDAIHTPVQVLNPDLSANGSVDMLEASRVRRALLENAVEHDLLIVPAHFRGPRCMRVERTRRGFVPHFPQEH